MLLFEKHPSFRFTDPDITIREDLYDLIVDVAGSNVTYPDHAGKLFGMGKIHKEIAMYLTTAAEDDTIKETDMLRVSEGRRRKARAGRSPLCRRCSDCDSISTLSFTPNPPSPHARFAPLPLPWWKSWLNIGTG